MLLCGGFQPGEDEYTVVPDSKIVVSRTAYKDNTSSYSVNGKRATYKEVAALLRGSGIDLDHNRFLILQVLLFEGLPSFFQVWKYFILLGKNVPSTDPVKRN